MKNKSFKSLYFLSCLVAGLTLLSCNQIKSEVVSSEQNNPIKEIALPDSIIDAGIVENNMILLYGGKKDTYFAKALKAHMIFNSILANNEEPDKEKLKEIYSEAIYNYSLSLEKEEYKYREHIVLQNRALLRRIYGDYYGAISDYDTLLEKQTLNEQEFLVLKAYCYIKLEKFKESEQVIDSVLMRYHDAREKAEKNEPKKITKSKYKFNLPPITVDNTFLASAFYYKGLLNYLKGNNEDGCFNWSKASELNEKVSKYAALDAIQGYCK